MNVTLRQLRVFIEVARLQSFSRAGDEIGLTQSAVSRCVRELEGEIGLKLIDRTTREVQLTDVGGNLVSSVSRLLTDLDDALREIREIGEQRRGRVVVAASPTVACRLMPRVVAACGRQFPYITLGLRDDVQSDVVRKVKSGEVDFGVIIGPFSADDLLSESLMTDSFCVVAREDHPLAARERVAWTDLDGQQLVMLDYASGSRPIIDAVMQEYGVSATVVQELGHSATVFGLVEAGVGVSVLPWLALPLPAGAALVARPLVPRAERTVELVRRRDRSLSPAAEAVWSLIRQLPARAEDLN
ncbi:LysR family transcriptional regulator [Paraburkholderia fungorum]|jgi:DNA-binding transcriptional LysR family regulator|uniref:Bacterial regulatory helix-turn-helix, lysR family protein n=1 Tax=Paraburkholderia fungorum TaxID=134537 RepID=A0AAJ4CEZ1_9BURK|nr:LysR family transcriptional regulator [Paraburkholderia fungorum]AJZ59338.1 bacterial regulatory helix-turn-helix, lysR family protein [Paraburkholderia fungorum]MBB4514323.1 DNA-binding transcriptional LysR family regulator [Paraburkholderia fungorum]MBB5547241.1 DNA-binding transcriptional LysR family regulator [Paraburkholderia fungorum]MBB6202135.1 DNA-binding transcriptional LysR family regulator [Paraburkholderia fungorum]MDE1011065.1 LysR substrate-binding domain-containing protein [